MVLCQLDLASTETKASARPFTERGVLLVALILLLAHAPLLVWQAHELWRRPHYQFFPLVMIAALLLAVRKSRTVGECDAGSSTRSAAIFGVSWVLLFVGVLIQSPWLGTIAMETSLLGLAHLVGGFRLVRAVLPPWLLLLTITPLPLGFDGMLVDGLQGAASRWSGQTLDFFGVPHVMEGNVVRVPGHRLFVEQSCSGVNSLFVMLAGALSLAVLNHRTFVRALCLMTASAGWVLLANVCRVSLVALLITRWGVDFSGGWRHELLGFLLFGLTLGLLVSTDALLRNIGESARRAKARFADWRAGYVLPDGYGRSEFGPQEAEVERRSPPAVRPNDGAVRARPASIISMFVVAYGALIVFQFVPALQAVPKASRPSFQVTKEIDALGLETLPTEWQAFRRQGFKVDLKDTSSGQSASRVWSFRWKGHDLAVSVDYPFYGWHELTACYKHQGWKLVEREVRREPRTSLVFVEARFQKAIADQAYLLFSVVDHRGENVEPLAVRGVIASVYHRLSDARRLRVLGFNQDRPPQETAAGIQVQLFLESEFPLTAGERVEVVEFFRHVHRTLAGQVRVTEGNDAA